RINIMDSSMRHEFDLTPSMSLTFNCTSQEQLDQLWAALSEGGRPLMPLDDYGFGPFGWIADSYGVSWQLNYNPSLPPTKSSPWLLFGTRKHVNKHAHDDEPKEDREHDIGHCRRQSIGRPHTQWGNECRGATD